MQLISCRLILIVEGERVMQHLAIIPDGNRRWAEKNKLRAVFGHKKGVDAIEGAIKVCLKNGIKFLSFYTFSLENFNRSEEEKAYLFDLLINELLSQLPIFLERNIRVKFLGDASFFPQSVKPMITKVEEETKECNALQLNLLFCYGAQQEIVQAMKDIAVKVKNNELLTDDITVDSFGNHLWTKGIPNPELIIRTSKVCRLSNFLLFQAAYSEFIFLDNFWPETTEEMLEECVSGFLNVKRNFGK